MVRKTAYIYTNKGTRLRRRRRNSCQNIDDCNSAEHWRNYLHLRCDDLTKLICTSCEEKLELDVMLDFYEHTLRFDKTQMHSLKSIIGMELMNFLSVIITHNMAFFSIKGEEKAPSQQHKNAVEGEDDPQKPQRGMDPCILSDCRENTDNRLFRCHDMFKDADEDFFGELSSLNDLPRRCVYSI